MAINTSTAVETYRGFQICEVVHVSSKLTYRAIPLGWPGAKVFEADSLPLIRKRIKEWWDNPEAE